MKKTILTLGAIVIILGSYCTSNKTGETSTDTTTITKVDNVVTLPETKADTQQVTLPKTTVEEPVAQKPEVKLPPPVVVKTKPAAGGTDKEIIAGGLLIKKSDCLACHNEVNKIVGPAYNAVAQKYAVNDGNINYLAGKIISGGSGVWGEIPMSAHPNLSKADATLMAKYILSLKK